MESVIMLTSLFKDEVELLLGDFWCRQNGGGGFLESETTGEIAVPRTLSTDILLRYYVRKDKNISFSNATEESVKGGEPRSLPLLLWRQAVAHQRRSSDRNLAPPSFHSQRSTERHTNRVIGQQAFVARIRLHLGLSDPRRIRHAGKNADIRHKKRKVETLGILSAGRTSLFDNVIVQLKVHLRSPIKS
jgi:hypothetical protein